MAVSESYFPAVIVICVNMNTTVRARSFKIGSLQFMLLPYEDAVSQTFVASCDVGRAFGPERSPLAKFLMSCYRQSRFASSLTQHPPEIVFCLTECTIRQHCSARTAVLLATSKQL